MDGKKYNVIILAGGAGSRMGTASDFIPKALTKLGDKRAIDYIIEKYINVAHKFIIGTSYHADLLESYIKGKYGNLPIEFSREPVEELKNNGMSTILCLDHADSRYGTIITFCDLLVIGNNQIIDDSVLVATDKTKGNVGMFRHYFNLLNIIENKEPLHPDGDNNGIMGSFTLSDTPSLKKIAYEWFTNINDLTYDIIFDYNETVNLKQDKCDTVYEFGDDNDLKKVRELWEQVEK